MQEKYLFEYAVMRIVPRVEREEFLNVGVILYCKDRQFLECRYVLDRGRLQSFCAGFDCDEVEEHLQAFEWICKGAEKGGAIARLDIASRFRWLTATRSTIVQSSKFIPASLKIRMKHWKSCMSNWCFEKFSQGRKGAKVKSLSVLCALA